MCEKQSDAELFKWADVMKETSPAKQDMLKKYAGSAPPQPSGTNPLEVLEHILT